MGQISSLVNLLNSPPDWLKDQPDLLDKLRDRVIFFENYNIYEAPFLFQGADGVFMLSDKNKEAAATGFMKGQMNGKGMFM